MWMQITWSSWENANPKGTDIPNLGGRTQEVAFQASSQVRCSAILRAILWTELPSAFASLIPVGKRMASLNIHNQRMGLWRAVHRLKGEKGHTFPASKITESTLEVSVVEDDTISSPSQPGTSIMRDEMSHGSYPWQESLSTEAKCNQQLTKSTLALAWDGEWPFVWAYIKPSNIE